jgi:hypothetical protein
MLEQPMLNKPINIAEDCNTIAIECDQWPIRITLCMTAISGGVGHTEFMLSADELALCLIGKSTILNFTDRGFAVPDTQAHRKTWTFDCHDTIRFMLAMMLPIAKLAENIDDITTNVQIVKHPTGLTAKVKFNEFGEPTTIRFSDAPIKPAVSSRRSEIRGVTTGHTLEIHDGDITWHLPTDNVTLRNDHAIGLTLEAYNDPSPGELEWQFYNRGVCVMHGVRRRMIRMDMSIAYMIMLLIKLNAGQITVSE